jgi:hypothetical protein
MATYSLPHLSRIAETKTVVLDLCCVLSEQQGTAKVEDGFVHLELDLIVTFQSDNSQVGMLAGLVELGQVVEIHGSSNHVKRGGLV